MPGTNEAFSRVKIDAQLKDQRWEVLNTNAVRFEYVLPDRTCFPDSVVGFLPGESVTTAYVQGWLSFLQPTLEANAPQAAQKNINLEILKALPIPVPPLPVQTEFVRRCDAVLSMRGLQAMACDKAEAAFSALLARVFSPRTDDHSDDEMIAQAERWLSYEF